MKKVVLSLLAVCVLVPNLFAGQFRCDVCVYGGTAGGVMAAVQAARMGCKVILVSENSHVGGVATSGLTATDINKHLAVGGLAAEFYGRIYDYYLSEQAWRCQTREEFMRSTLKRTYSGKNDSRRIQWVYESHIGERIMREMLDSAGVKVIFNSRLSSPDEVTMRGSHIRSLKFKDGLKLKAKMFIDASYEGDLMAYSGVSYRVGRESTAEYGESLAGIREHAFIDVSPYNEDGSFLSGVFPNLYGELGASDNRTQAYCYRVTLTDDPENSVPLTEPKDYNPADYELILRRIQSGEKKELKDIITFTPMPNRKTDTNHLDFIGESYDYPEASWPLRDSIALRHRHYAEGVLWFLGHDPRVPEKMREEMLRWGWPKDEFVDNGHFPHQLYVRESRRMVGEYVMTQNDIQKSRKETAESVIGLGTYPLDCHFVGYVATPDGVMVEGGMFVPIQPYRIFYESILPKRGQCDNLLVPVCLSASHVAYASLRMEPVFMILSQSAAAAAVLSLRNHCIPQELNYDSLRSRLLSDGQILEYKK